MNKFILSGILVIILISVVIILQRDKINNDSQNLLSLGDCKFSIEEAIDDESRQRGLSGRSKLCNNCGMLFIFSKVDKYGFWMKDMQFPLDIIWIRENKIVEIKENISQNSMETFYPSEDIDRVLEINANEANRCNIKIGDKIK